MINKDLQTGIDSAICRENINANNNTTRHTISLRVLRKITNYMRLDWTDIPDVKTHIYLDDSLRECMSQCCGSEPNEELEKIMAKDYIKPIELVKFVSIVQRKDSKQPIPENKPMNQMLAVDGFMDDLKRYVEHLKYDENDFRGAHVRAVRKLYETLKNPQEINDILNCAFGWKNCEMTEYVNLYIESVGNKLESIKEWKKHQLQEEMKRKELLAGKKRKSTEATQPRKKSRKMAHPVRGSVKETTTTLSTPSNESTSESETLNSNTKEEEESSSSESEKEVEK